jgi:hypothetical protein
VQLGTSLNREDAEFLIALLLVVVLDLLAVKAIEAEDDDENGKTRKFPGRTRGRRPRSAGEESYRRRGRPVDLVDYEDEREGDDDRGRWSTA